MLVRNLRTIFVTFYITLLVLIECGLITPREMDIRRANQMGLKKRPFCNAFTGCGRKRSEDIRNHQFGQEELENDNSIGDLIDLNAEPAVDDLMRQIMSQAKLFEAIQEVSKEISSQRKGNLEHQNKFPLAFNAQ